MKKINKLFTLFLAVILMCLCVALHFDKVQADPPPYFQVAPSSTGTVPISYTAPNGNTVPAGASVTMYNGVGNNAGISYFQDSSGNKYEIYQWNGGYKVEPVPVTMNLGAAAAGYEELAKTFWTGSPYVNLTDTGKAAQAAGYLNSDGSITQSGTTTATNNGPSYTITTPPAKDANGVSPVTPDSSTTYQRITFTPDGNSAPAYDTILTPDNSVIKTGSAGTFVDYFDPTSGTHMFYKMEGTRLEPVANQTTNLEDLADGNTSGAGYVPGAINPTSTPPTATPTGVTTPTAPTTPTPYTQPPLQPTGGLVPCSGADCTIGAFFTLLLNIYNFIVQDIATPLAILSISIGGIIMMISAGNPNLLGLGKKIFYAAIIGLVLVFCSWLIINFIMQAVGYTGAWSSLP